MKVYEAINKVQAELAKEGISKSRKNQQQGYNFRGIDDVYNALSPALSKHGLCVLPRVLGRECVERQTARGNALFYVTVEVEFDFVCAEDGSKHTVKTYGEAMDSADKATNKAMSAAYKYAAMQAFAIPTEGDNDADASTHEVVARSQITPAGGIWDSMSPDEQRFLQEIAEKALTMEPGAAMHFIEEQKLDPDEKVALWTRFDSKTRAAMKAAKDSLKEAA